MADFKLFINGEFCDAASGETFATYNPATGEKIADVPKAGKEDADPGHRGRPQGVRRGSRGPR